MGVGAGSVGGVDRGAGGAGGVGGGEGSDGVVGGVGGWKEVARWLSGTWKPGGGGIVARRRRRCRKLEVAVCVMSDR